MRGAVLVGLLELVAVAGCRSGGSGGACPPGTRVHYVVDTVAPDQTAYPDGGAPICTARQLSEDAGIRPVSACAGLCPFQEPDLHAISCRLPPQCRPSAVEAPVRVAECTVCE